MKRRVMIVSDDAANRHRHAAHIHRRADLVGLNVKPLRERLVVECARARLCGGIGGPATMGEVAPGNHLHPERLQIIRIGTDKRNRHGLGRFIRPHPALRRGRNAPLHVFPSDSRRNANGGTYHMRRPPDLLLEGVQLSAEFAASDGDDVLLRSKLLALDIVELVIDDERAEQKPRCNRKLNCDKPVAHPTAAPNHRLRPGKHRRGRKRGKHEGRIAAG